MKKKTLILLTIIIAICFFKSIILCAPSFVDNFLKTEIGAIPLGMGGAYTAIATDDDAFFYNPAGLGLSGIGITYEMSDIKKNTYQRSDHYSLIFNPIGFSYRTKADTLNFAETYNYAFGYKGYNGVNWGINYKTVKTSGSQNKNGWSFDLGLLVNFTRNFNFGVLLQDFCQDSLTVNMTVRPGIAIFTDDKNLTFASDFVARSNTDCYLNFGIAYNIINNLTLRAGSNNNKFTGGISLNLGIINANTALVTNPNNQPDYLFSVALKTDSFLSTNPNFLIKEKTFAEVRIDNTLVEGKSENSFFGGYKLGSNDLLTNLYQARNNRNCQGFLVHIGNLNTNLASIGLIQEIREELLKAKKSGKIVICYLEDYAGLTEYYLATAGNKIIMPSLGLLSHLGIDVEVTKTKKYLENFGIEKKVITEGKYKSSLNPDSNQMTQEEKQQINELIRNLYQQVIYDVEYQRNIPLEKIATNFDGRLISAEKAKSLNLIDELGYWDQVKDTAKKLTKAQEIKTLPLTYFLDETTPATFLRSFNRIAVIEVDGELKLGKNSHDIFFGGKDTGADDIDNLVEKIKNDFTIRGVILRINCPGGDIIASDKIYTAISKLKKANKKVYASMGDIAASGGYYIALSANKIYANPATLTGSIGVISAFKNYTELYKILGIDVDVIKTGKYMDMFSQNKKMTKEEETMFKELQKKHYDYFVTKVAENRKIPEKELTEICQGQIFTGDQAQKIGLVDKLGSFNDAITDLKAEVAIIGDPILIFYRNNYESVAK